MIKALFATQGGGTALYDDQQKSYLFHDVPDWMENTKSGDFVPAEWGVQNVGWISTDAVEEMSAAERDGYEVGYSGKADNHNTFVESSFYHQEWKAGYERGCKERLAMDTDLPDYMATLKKVEPQE